MYYSGHITQRSKNQRESEVDMDDAEMQYKNEGSEERIVGIKKTVSIELTYLERSGEVNTEGNKTYEKHLFDRHDV